MKSYIQCVLFIMVVLMATICPDSFVSFSNTDLGNLVFVLLLVGFSVYDKLCGLFMLLLLISLKQQIVMVEGMTSYAVDNFRKNYCKKNDLTNKKGKKVSLEDIGSQFPNLNFDADKCNPCDEGCKFKVTSNNEKLSIMEALRSENSNNWPVSGGGGNKNIDSNEKQVETFTNIFSAFMDNESEPEPVMLKMSK